MTFIPALTWEYIQTELIAYYKYPTQILLQPMLHVTTPSADSPVGNEQI